ncbi:hypothetical protein AXG55_13815 [Silvanigrella aquatica]|uniref:Uncharacterized protein n=1 Tax=Silvanigrella aquatica TaxID=1915309 RepID=A0A1L4D3Y2_9BACT|nr:hypothetical protein AXG55_13815 [Silvanigrella aquatica]
MCGKILKNILIYNLYKFFYKINFLFLNFIIQKNFLNVSCNLKRINYVFKLPVFVHNKGINYNIIFYLKDYQNFI